MRIKSYPLVLFILLIFKTSLFAQFQYTQYFDGADTVASKSIIVKLDTSHTNIWQIGKPHKTIFHKAATVPNAIVTDTIHYYPNNNISRFTFQFVRVTNYGVLALQWMQKLDLDTNHDGGIIEYSTNKGLTWVNVFNNPSVLNFYGFQQANRDTLATGEYAFSGRDTSWRNIWLCFNPSFIQTYDTTLFRFTLKTDSVNNNREGWMIDNMMINLTMIHPVNEMKKTEFLNVFPTVTNGIINIESRIILENVPVQSIDLIGVDGKLIEHFTNSSSKYQIDISKYEAGMYFLKITSDIRTENHPVMLLKQ
jgi:hypothetical protein